MMFLTYNYTWISVLYTVLFHPLNFFLLVLTIILKLYELCDLTFFNHLKIFYFAITIFISMHKAVQFVQKPSFS